MPRPPLRPERLLFSNLSFSEAGFPRTLGGHPRFPHRLDESLGTSAGLKAADFSLEASADWGPSSSARLIYKCPVLPKTSGLPKKEANESDWSI